MKLKRQIILSACLAVIAFTGCKSLSNEFGANPAPPSPIEQKIYTTATNWVTETTQVAVTNYTVVLLTNTQNQVIQETNTSFQVVTLTNQVPSYTLTASPQTSATIQGAGAVINTFAPGIGTAVAAGLTALVGLFGWGRSAKNATATSTTLAQEIETLREFVQALPQGANYDSAIVSWLQAHQMESGVATTILNAVENNVSNPSAKAAAASIITTLNTMGTKVPTPNATSGTVA